MDIIPSRVKSHCVEETAGWKKLAMKENKNQEQQASRQIGADAMISMLWDNDIQNVYILTKFLTEWLKTHNYYHYTYTAAL